MPPIPLFLAIAFLLFTHVAAQSTAPLQHGGKTYKTIKIGTQTWMAENMNYEAEGSKCYKNSPDNCAKHGRLYNWQTAMKVCPKGWHLPNNAEWDKLFRFVDGDTSKGERRDYYSDTAGKYLKATSGWNDDGNGTNVHGFSALPGGSGNPGSSFGFIGSVGYWWSATECNYDSNYAYYRFMYYGSDYGLHGLLGKSILRSVRCVQD